MGSVDIPPSQIGKRDNHAEGIAALPQLQHRGYDILILISSTNLSLPFKRRGGSGVSAEMANQLYGQQVHEYGLHTFSKRLTKVLSFTNSAA